MCCSFFCPHRHGQAPVGWGWCPIGWFFLLFHRICVAEKLNFRAMHYCHFLSWAKFLCVLFAKLIITLLNNKILACLFFVCNKQMLLCVFGQKNRRIKDEKYNKMELNDKHFRKSLYTSDCILVFYNMFI